MIKFKQLIVFTSLLIAGCAAYFSVYGIGMLFSGAMIASIIMAASLELGKLVTTSWLFRYWDKANIILRTYMIIAVFVLMGITSIGIFGFLTAAFQKSSIETEISANKVVTLESQKKEELAKIESTKKTIDRLYSLRNSQENRLNETLTNVLIARNPIQLQNIQNQINDQISDINKQLEAENLKLKSFNDKSSFIDDNILKVKIENSQKKDIITFKFVADQFNTTIQNVVKWFILILITVFDPLAVVLLLAYNITTNKNEYEIYNEPPLKPEDKNTNKPDNVATTSTIVEKIVEKPVEVEKIVEKIVEKPVEKIIKVPVNKPSGVRGMFSF